MHDGKDREPLVQTVTSGRVAEDDVARAERAVRSVLAGVPGRTASARVTLTVLGEPAPPRPALAQAIVELDGRRLRAQAAARSLPEAIELMQHRLAHKASWAA
ncbi:MULTISPECIES: hypothetical protein [Thermomonospora]|uniref:Uncharacterized protein n=1 Tax=Thermomonospora curvata (strain ATCC 19995 / DSM 43183 / JCM 3096 / KCTC 9072 / NBRC 15933 / NCIMB 10081 / Henssen B9) TaxID=471852 RepID=D1A5R8_THECD|nr:MULTISPECIES: hypothetical protein [Thermomonospora]ACY98213.1 hypothetical protein Tcur_2661 [Thermomonospora curvata DSM 43183]PKK13980.1 MAG: hypothetical protein BUE48_013010 [Thermomonospora sp. CIF 1]